MAFFRNDSAFKSLFKKYRRIVIFDTETTGLNCRKDQIIEFAAVVIEKKGIIKEFDELIQLEPGTRIPDDIVALTGITNEACAEKGITKTLLRAHLHDMFAPYPTLLVAYNAHFDLCFTYYLLQGDDLVYLLQGKDKLDLLTVYKDRHSYPHKLKNAIEVYNLQDKVQNSHRAIDDVLATVAVMEEMEKEKDDFLSYVNLFGYNPKYGAPKPAIRSITYKPQQFDPQKPLYETP
ncbi:MAG: 3'-5' exonuclease [Oscillospiraceae bacterium]|nr:3'-5' exonuclease [Oscillospiraceae bacterium]